MVDALPPVLREAVRLALADLRHPVAVPLEKVTFEPDPDGDGVGMLTVWFADGSGGGFGLETGGDPAEVTADVADQIQGLFHEERESWGEARRGHDRRAPSWIGVVGQHLDRTASDEASVRALDAGAQAPNPKPKDSR